MLQAPRNKVLKMDCLKVSMFSHRFNNFCVKFESYSHSIVNPSVNLNIVALRCTGLDKCRR